MQKIISLILGFITALSLASEGIPYMFRPTLEIDASLSCGEISTKATGFLYGLAQSNVPDSNIVESLDISSVSQKVIGGLQHPIGDVDNVSPQLGSCDYIVVYLQDCFDTWYYCHEEINELRKNGNYDALRFMRERFLPEVREKVTELSKKDYADRLVYCLYNECDNAVWFGTPNEDASWYHFDDAAKELFYSAWEETYDLVRSIHPDAMIGGPGYCDYDAYEIRHFLNFCKNNDCLPDVMIYHELSEISSSAWKEHTDEYRSIESKLGIKDLPIIVTEYGTMQECGNPADMLQYIVQMEQTGTYGNVAYWRLANNLCDTAADNNSPNSNWWLYRWYADMEGDLLKSKIIDIPHSDFANIIKYNRKAFRYDEMTGMASMNGKKIEVLFGGCDYSSEIVIKNIGKTQLKNSKVNVNIECVYFEGLSGVVSKPVTVTEYTDKIGSGKLKIRLNKPDANAVYHIVITEAEAETGKYVNNSLPVRFEFENGTLLGTSYTYDSAYATTGETKGMVGGFEHIGDGVKLDFSVPESGKYDLGIIFGNSNDGSAASDRTFSTALFTLDGEAEEICFPNTIKSEYTDRYSVNKYLEKGNHSITLEHKQGTFVVDSLIIRPVDTNNSIALIYDSDRSINSVTSYLAVAPDDGFYTLETEADAVINIDGAEGKAENGKATVYLRRGLNYIDIQREEAFLKVEKSDKKDFVQTFSPNDLIPENGAVINENGYLESMSENGECASMKVTVPESGDYRITVTYSNNLEGGYHAYNVDLIESFITVTTANESKNIWCRSTYSYDTYKTVTFNLYLDGGENTLTLSNNGEYDFNGNVPVTPRIKEITVNKAIG